MKSRTPFPTANYIVESASLDMFCETPQEAKVSAELIRNMNIKVSWRSLTTEEKNQLRMP